MIDSIDVTIGFLLILGIGVPIEYCLLKVYYDWKDKKTVNESTKEAKP